MCQNRSLCSRRSDKSFSREKEKSKTVPINFYSVLSFKKLLIVIFFSAPSTFLWSEHRKSFDPGASIVSRIKDLDLTLN